MEEVCQHPKVSENMVTFKNGTKHLERTCDTCKKHLGYQGYQNAETAILPFGKYKGLPYAEVAKEDADYLNWIRTQEWCKPRMKELIDEALNPKTSASASEEVPF